MSTPSWIACIAWTVGALVTGAVRGLRGFREGRGSLAAGRSKSPMIYFFTTYLLIAALVTPRSTGESMSPLLWLALLLPVAYGCATLSSIGSAQPRLVAALGLAVLHGGAVLAGAALVLALVSPGFVPAWLR